MPAQSMELLQGLDDEQTAAVMARAERIRLAAGDVLFRLGDAADRLYVIEWGRLALELPMRVRQADEDVLVEERQPGEIVGWSAVVPPHRLTLTATALSETQVIALRRDRLLELLEARPDIGYALMRNVSRVLGHRLQVMQAMWLREMQRFVSVAHG